MNRYIQAILLIIMAFLSQLSQAQTYPVQVVPTVISPYSSKLSDYSNGMVNRINLQLITTDVLVQNHPVQLHLKIQGNGITAQSAPVLSGIRPIYLNGGEILSLNSAELSSYFTFQNLQGITASQYSKSLPDGVYTICFQVYDAVTKKRLSQNSCATIYLMLNDPPQLNLPSNNEQIPSTDFTNIIFSWTPRQINATNVSYEYELKEILDPNLDPRFAFEISPLLYKEELRSTTLLYDVSKPTLIPGKRYAWRVKAISTNGLGENSIFKNNGYSEVYTFSQITNCSAPRFLLSEQQSNSRVKVMWQGESIFKKYHIQYRKSDVDNAEWFEAFSLNTQTILSNLEPGFTYEFRVGASCETTSYGVQQSYVYSNIQTFSLENKDKNNTATKYNCGILPKIEITNEKLLPTMVINETFMAGDFPVKVLDVSGDNGVYSGNGYIQVPYLFDTRIKVDFSGITINEDYQLIRGVVETTYNPEWSNVDFVDDLWDVNQQEIVLDFPIKKIEIVKGQNEGDIPEIKVIGENGNSLNYPGGKDTIITDSKGKSYYVDSNGTVSGPFEQAEGGKTTPENTDGVDSKGGAIAYTAKGISVTFEIHKDSKYVYDKVSYKKALTKDYKEINGEFIPFKAVVNGSKELFVAKVNISNPEVKADSIIFKTKSGVKINAERIDSSNDYVLELIGRQKFAVEEVQATIKQGDKYKIAGVFNLVHISPRNLQLKLVPTSENVKLDDKVADIKAIYSQLGIEVQVEVEDVFDISKHLSEGKLPTEDESRELSTYSKAQQAVIADFKEKRTVKEAYYLFVTDVKSSTGQSGYMGLNNQFGFVFDNNAFTMAHELGHGAFRLEHPFKQYKKKGLSRGNTQSIMDYPPGKDFLFTDWKQVNDPKFRLYAFQKQSEGELLGQIWINPLGEPFKLENTSKDLIYLNGGTKPGSVAGYFVGIEKPRELYKWNSTKKAYTLNGSDDDGSEDTKYYKKQNPKDNDLINLYLENGGCGKDKRYKATYKYVKDNYTIEEGIDFTDNINVKYIGNITCENETKTKTIEQFFEEVTFPSIKDVQLLRSEDISQDKIDELVSAVNSAVGKSISGYTYDKYIDKNKLGRIAIQDDISTTAEQLFKIDHKLVYLSEYTKDLQSQTLDIYVVYHKVDYFITNGWNDLAKKVYGSSILNDSVAALILIPYFDFTKEHVAVTSKVDHYMPGLYAKGIQIETSKIERLPSTEFRATEGIANPYKGISIATTIKFINSVYDQTYKPAEIFYGLRYADGTISDEHIIIKEYRPGANGIKFVLLKEHDYFKKINQLSKPQQWIKVRAMDGYEERINENYYLELLKYQIEKARLEDEARANISNDTTWNNINSTDIIDFKEKFLNQELARRYIYGYAYHNQIKQFCNDVLSVVLEEGHDWKKYELDHTYNKEGWTIIDEVVYGTLDIVSLPLMPFGLDVFPDAVGFLYSVGRQDITNSAIYGSSIAVPFYSAGAARMAIKLLKKSDDVVLIFRQFKYLYEGDKVVKIPGSSVKESVLGFFNINNKNLISEKEIDDFCDFVIAKNVDKKAINKILKETDETKRIQAIKSIYYNNVETKYFEEIVSNYGELINKEKGIIKINKEIDYATLKKMVNDKENYFKLNKREIEKLNKKKGEDLRKALESIVNKNNKGMAILDDVTSKFGSHSDNLRQVITNKKGLKIESYDEFLFEFSRNYASCPTNSVKPLDDIIADFKHLLDNADNLKLKDEQFVAFLNEFFEHQDKFKAGGTSLEVIRNYNKYIPNDLKVQNLELEDFISILDDAGEFRFDIKFNGTRIIDNIPTEISIFIDTKNYSTPHNMFKDLRQIKAYLGEIHNFDEFYIIQQSGRNFGADKMKEVLQTAIQNDVDDVFKTIWKNVNLRNNVFEKIGIKSKSKASKYFSDSIDDLSSELYNSLLITK